MESTGFGLIETVRVHAGRIPLLDRHLARLERSLDALGLPRPTRELTALLRPFAEMGEAALRVEVSDGRATVTVRELPSADVPAVITAAEPHQPYPHKTTQRDCFADAAVEADVAEADDALLVTHEGFVAEGTAWNVFWWDGEALVTPALDLGVLPGVARTRVAELVGFREGRYPRAALAGRSVFLTNALRGVQAIESLDGERVPRDPRTADLARRFWPGA